jgi:hypothetical protein
MKRVNLTEKLTVLCGTYDGSVYVHPVPETLFIVWYSSSVHL